MVYFPRVSYLLSAPSPSSFLSIPVLAPSRPSGHAQGTERARAEKALPLRGPTDQSAPTYMNEC
eukprot:5978365-Pyramimonas_sp.AAC.1